MQEEKQRSTPRARRPGPILAWATLALLAIAVALLWIVRVPIAQATADRYLRDLGLPARYAIGALTPGRAVVRNLQIGPAGRPDLEAEQAVLRLDWSGGQPRLRSVVLVRPVLRARLLPDGRLSLGTLDRLLEPRTGEPPAWPDQRVEVEDGLIELGTPWGRVRGILNGRGNIARDFRGSLAVRAGPLRLPGCDLAPTGGRLRLATDQRLLRANGRLRSRALACGESRAGDLSATLDFRMPQSLAMLSGRATVKAGMVEARDVRAGATVLRVAANGSPDRLLGDWLLDSSDGVHRWATLRAFGGGGTFEAAPAARSLSLQGRISFRGFRSSKALQRKLGTPWLSGTPLHGHARALQSAVVRALGEAAGDFRVELADAGQGGGRAMRATVSDVVITARSGGRASLDGRLSAALNGPGLAGDGRLAITGGGLPRLDAEFAYDPGQQRMSGRLRLAEWRVPDARLALPELRFAAAGEAATLAGRLAFSGPVGGARLEGLDLPIALAVRLGRRPTLHLTDGCVAPSILGAAHAAGSVAPARLRICARGPLIGLGPDGRLSGGFASEDVRLSGTAGPDRQPWRLDIGRLALSWRGTREQPAATIALRTLDVVQGRSAEAAHGHADSLDARVTSGDRGLFLAGRLSGGRGSRAQFPLRASEIGGRVVADASGLALADGTMRIDDAAGEAARFQPVAVHRLELRLAGGTLAGRGELRNRETGVRIAPAMLRHHLGTGTGGLLLDPVQLHFGPAIQPYQLTESLRGLIESVEGPLTGRAVFHWSPGGIDSFGRFRVEQLSLATASLGPVRGVTGDIAFDDLLALRTPPGQLVTIGSINPGVEVRDGQLRYQLLPDLNVAIEGAQWPLAGGLLLLDPSRFSWLEPDRRYTLRVSSVDAGRLLQMFEVENISATGVLDGVLPLVFDRTGGSIVGGTLASRPPGGRIRYVGDLSRGQLGAAAGLAFDALKDLRYRSLTVALDGQIDGEIVSQLRFSGANNAPVRPLGRLPVYATDLPFRFSVTVQAPFRALLRTAGSFSDARGLVRDRLAEPEPAEPADPELAEPEPAGPEPSEPADPAPR